MTIYTFFNVKLNEEFLFGAINAKYRNVRSFILFT